ncbi:transcriptional regulator [Jannaschia pagri]|uniref:Transcriptional regulator n=1 Tax=Jannaschia pagri TaxID=2829797 RepID=A0ABQ4NRL9_9RHOB|nr:MULTISPECIES: AraC family transcriptional regulator [unclassified Jannaschia]GIT93263.1 transcriptional regulator [Jannaschia sp. AI_61]GIT97070.1 transcriptional regulator [Jannaschia sp. AI_62]
MPSVSLIVTQYFAAAAGFVLTPDGRLSQDDEALLTVSVANGKLAAQAHYDILGLVAERVPDRAAVSIRHARSIDIDRFGTFALACKAAPTVAGVLERMARYHSLLSDSVRYHLDQRDGAAVLRQELLAGSGPGLVFSPEAGLSAMFRAIDQVAVGKVTPDLVTFRHSPPRDAQLFEDFFGCHVQFHGAEDAILFGEATLGIENRLGDRALSDFLTTHLEAELSALETEPTLVRATKDEIARVLSEGLPKMADVASTLGLSVRSFHRRLAEHGVSFQALAEETRRDLALSMLRDEACALSEIAFLTGFSEQSAFTRAFKRWTDQTPASYRKSLDR